MTATIQAHPKAGPSFMTVCVQSLRPPDECDADNTVRVVRKRVDGSPVWLVKQKSSILGLIWQTGGEGPYTWATHKAPTYQTGVSADRNDAVKQILRRVD